MSYDVIVIGGGHNGLVAGAALAKLGKRVVILERKGQVGGCLANEMIGSGVTACPTTPYGQDLRPRIRQELQLSHLEFRPYDPMVVSVGEQPLALWESMDRAQNSIRQLSAADAEAYPQFQAFLDKVVKAVESLLDTIPVSPDSKEILGLIDLANVGLKTRLLGSQDLHRLMRLTTMSLKDFLDEWFENDRLKAALAAPALAGHYYGPYQPGTATLLLYSRLGGSQGLFLGGMGALTESLAEALKSLDGEIRCNSEVDQILVQNGTASGVKLVDGSELHARHILSTAAPKNSLKRWLSNGELPPSQQRKLRNLLSRGTTTVINLVLKEAPQIDGLTQQMLKGRLEFVQSLEELEQASDGVKYGIWPGKPWVSAWCPSQLDKGLAENGQCLMQLEVRWTPYHLKEGDWSKPDELVARAIATVSAHCRGFEQLIVSQRVVTPLDLEREWSLSEGHIFQGERNLHQLYFGRPISGWSRYETPIKNLFLGGAGTHPGCTTTGASGHLAAQSVLEQEPSPQTRAQKARKALTSPLGAGIATAAGLSLLGAGLAVKKMLKAKKDPMEPADELTDQSTKEEN
jgi:phytoene dehydrogenase-like protein